MLFLPRTARGGQLCYRRRSEGSKSGESNKTNSLLDLFCLESAKQSVTKFPFQEMNFFKKSTRK